ncbi:uncharacterized protein BP5553_00479 [Venustampulla echinocandica]|uniref:Uncharacterized protein n=1 Tax=Venustampulla echinocandica TaxID=2656787 RepID=A0A370TYB0_9HELO|nr:uncharacterized protein BP5553_00479 [Venustampulla echinocandica]RDL40500.1 hypothetical protein BP5553_00479 [Venustampulla echinocandica]
MPLPPAPSAVRTKSIKEKGLISSERYEALYTTIKETPGTLESTVTALYQDLLPAVVYHERAIWSINMEQRLMENRSDFTFKIWRKDENGVLRWDTFLVGEVKAPSKTTPAALDELEDQLTKYLNAALAAKPAQVEFAYGVAMIGVRVRVVYMERGKGLKYLWNNADRTINSYFGIGDEGRKAVIKELFRRWIPAWSVGSEVTHQEFLTHYTLQA